jgi:hypothetical protein
MKVALCLHGLFDSLTDDQSKGLDGYNHIKKNILDVADTDVFVHSWEIEKMGEITKLYNPKSSIFEGQKDFSSVINKNKLNTLTSPPRPPQSVLSHLYSVTESIKLAYNHSTDYDIIIKARFDLGRINRRTSGPGRGNPYPVQCINFQTDIQKDKIYMANWQHFHMGPADMWFYGSQNTMKSFTTLYDSLERNMKVDSEFHQFASNIENNPNDLSNAIAFYKWWMVKNGLWDKRINLDTIWE